MTPSVLPLAMVPPGRKVTLISIQGGRGLRRRLYAMGLNEGMRLDILHSRGRGPCIVRVGNTRLVLGYGMARKMLVKAL